MCMPCNTRHQQKAPALTETWMVKKVYSKEHSVVVSAQAASVYKQMQQQTYGHLLLSLLLLKPQSKQACDVTCVIISLGVK